MKMKKVFILLSVFFLMGALMLRTTQAASDPVQLLQSIANQLIAELKANKTTLKSNPTVVYSMARRIVVPHADLDEMSKRVLPPRIWNSATPAQREQFKQEFTTLLVHTYANALADYTDQTVKFFPVRGGFQGQPSVRVDSQIVRTDGPSISMNYRVLWKGSEWRLYDMTVEGVSLLQSFRSQFAEKLSHGNMASLIQDMKMHNAPKR